MKCSKMFPDVCDIFFRPSGAGCSFSRPYPRLTAWAAFFRRFAAAHVVSASLNYFQCASRRDHTNAGADIDSAKAKSPDAVIAVTNAKSWFQIGNREHVSSEGAKECSPQRKLWVVGEKKGPAPEGAKEKFAAFSSAPFGVLTFSGHQSHASRRGLHSSAAPRLRSWRAPASNISSVRRVR